MPAKRSLEINDVSPQSIVLFVILAISIALFVYYVPSYFFLERVMADQSAYLLSIIGLEVKVATNVDQVFIDEFRIVRDCTGIQVIAVFTGLLAPVPKASWKKKLLTLGALYGLLHAANIFRIVLEYWLVYNGILPWSLAHYPLSLVLGVIGVFILVLVTDRLMPEFGDFLFLLEQEVKGKVMKGWK